MFGFKYNRFFLIPAFVFLAISSHLFFRYFITTKVYSPYSWKLWLISIAFLALAFSPLSYGSFRSVGRKLREVVRQFYFFHFINHRICIAFLSVLAAGTFFRAFRMGHFPWGPEGLLLDTSYFGHYAFKILDGEPYSPIGCGPAGYHDTLPFYLYAMFFAIFGPTITVLKCETVFIGVINAVLVFFIAKAVLKTMGGMRSNDGSVDDVNAVLLAVAGMGLYLFSSIDTVLNYSAFHAAFTTPIVLGCFLSLIWAFNCGSYFAFCFAGLLFGLMLSSSYYFLPTFPAFVIVIACFAVKNIIGRFKGKPKNGQCDVHVMRWWYSKIGVFFLGAIFVALPKVLYLVNDHTNYFFRTFVVLDKDIAAREHFTIIDNLIAKLCSPMTYNTVELMFFGGPRSKFMLCNSHLPIFDTFVAPVFFVGLIYSFARIRKERYLFLISYLLFTVVHCIISFPIDYRFIPFLPFFYIFFTVGLNLINKLLRFRKIFYILAGIYLLVIISFNVKNYHAGMGVKPLESFYHVKNTVLGRYLRDNYIDKKVYVCLTDCVWITKFSTYHNREKDIDRPTDGLGDRAEKIWKRCDGYTYNKILSNISRIISDNVNSEKDILLVFDEAYCNEEVVSYLESALNKESTSLSIYSKSCKENLVFTTVEIKKNELSSIDVASLQQKYKVKRHKAVKLLKTVKLVSGLTGKYYNDNNFTQLACTRVDETMNFQWHDCAPLPSMKPDNFSIEWDGYMRADRDGVYWFFIESDDGSRLWVDDDLIIDNWNTNVSYELCEPVYLETGLHKIRLQYYESEGTALVRLAWASEQFMKGYNRFYASEE